MSEFEPEILSSEAKIAFIRDVVVQVRQRTGIVPTPGHKREGSCFGARGGEWGNLFRAQLLNTTEETGEWDVLNDPKILDPLFEYLASEYSQSDEGNP